MYKWHYEDSSTVLSGKPEYEVTSEDVGHKLVCAISSLGNNKKHTLYFQTGYILAKDGTSVAAPTLGNLDMENHTLGFSGRDGKTYEYSLDGGKTWTEVTLNDTTVGSIPLGNKSYKAGTIQLRAKDGKTIVMNNDSTLFLMNFKGRKLAEIQTTLPVTEFLTTGKRGSYILVSSKYVQFIKLK